MSVSQRLYSSGLDHSRISKHHWQKQNIGLFLKVEWLKKTPAFRCRFSPSTAKSIDKKRPKTASKTSFNFMCCADQPPKPPDCITAAENSSEDRGIATCDETQPAPADWPNSMIRASKRKAVVMVISWRFLRVFRCIYLG